MREGTSRKRVQTTWDVIEQRLLGLACAMRRTKGVDLPAAGAAEVKLAAGLRRGGNTREQQTPIASLNRISAWAGTGDRLEILKSSLNPGGQVGNPGRHAFREQKRCQSLSHHSPEPAAFRSNENTAQQLATPELRS